MIERVWLRAYQSDESERAFDVVLTLIPVDKSITLKGREERSYGGLTMRFNVRNAEDAVITTPNGQTKEDLLNARLPWTDLTTQFPHAKQRSGAAVFVHPEHPDGPPSWLTRHYGPLCVGWPGVEAKSLPPGVPVRLPYRIWIHKTAVDPDPLKRAYAGYAAAMTEVRWQQ